MMTIDEIRRDNLLVAIERMGTATALAEKAKISSAYLSQIKNRTPESKTGKPKAMGDDVARKIEKALEEPEGWMDTRHSRARPDRKTGIPLDFDRSFGFTSERAPVGDKPATPQERLRAALPQDLAPELLARAIGDEVDIDIASRWLNGVGPEPTVSQAAAIQEAYGINMVWLMTGKGTPDVAVRYADEWRPFPITEMYGVPVRGMAQLGDNGHWVDIDYPDGIGEGYVDIPKKNRDTYAIKCVGDSMKPRIKNGEFVVIEPSVPYQPGDEVLVKAKDGRVMVKTFLYERQGRVHLLSVNENHPPMAIEADNIEKIHFVASINKPTQWRPD